jgi:Uma2 family endonuclease
MTEAARVLSVDGGVSIPADAFVQDGFRRWVMSDEFPSRRRATFAEGEVFFEMSPESIEAHNKVKKAFTAALENLISGENLGELYMDGAFLTNERAGLSTEPDVMFASWETLEKGRLVLTPGNPDGVELVGTPDVVVEVVSPSSIRKDTVSLRAAYARAGVSEYWLCDARGEEVKFEILRLESGVFVAASGRSASQESGVFARAFRLERERNRIGRWAYRLRY